MLFLHRISLEFLFAWFPFVRLHFSFMHVFSAPKAWSLLLALLFAPCCWFIILLFLSFWNTGGHSLNVLRFNFREFKPKEKMRKRALQKKIFFSFPLGSFLLGCLWEEAKNFDTRWKRQMVSPWYVPPLLWSRFSNKEWFSEKVALRRTRSCSLRSEVSSNTLKRFFCVAFSDADEFVCERKIPQNVFSAVFLSNGGKENFGRIKIGHI